jgi:transposase
VHGEEERMTETVTFVGIDVAEDWLDIVQLPAERHWQVANDGPGWDRLCTEVAAAPAPLIVLEATGKCEHGVVAALAAAGMTPVVANPLTIRRFAQSLGQHAKTDRCDAAVLAAYGQYLRPTPQPVPDATMRTLQALLARHRQLTKMLVAEQNRCRRAAPGVQPSHAALIAGLTEERGRIDARLAAVVASDPGGQARVDLLTSVPGIGAYTATAVAVGLPELGAATTKDLAALSGVAPYACESGRHQGERHIAGGRAAVRQALYQILTSMLTCNVVFRVHYDHLRAKAHVPKRHKVAMVACMRRLLGILNAMIRDRLTWQETDVGQGAFLAAA